LTEVEIEEPRKYIAPKLMNCARMGIVRYSEDNSPK
jgi:hypothetical protein